MTQNNANGVILMSLFLTLNIFHTWFSASIVNFEQVNADWVAAVYVNYTVFKKIEHIWRK